MIKIDIWSDINCPFCYIGKRHLEEALKNTDTEVKIEWKSFELDPQADYPKGADQTELLAKKYGRSLDWAKGMNQNMTEMAKASGLTFHMNKVIPANSFNAHRLIHLAKHFHKQDEMKERLLKARFEEGLDIGDLETLEKLGVEIGLPESEVKDLLSGDKYSEDVRRDESRAVELGIRGVPFFVINRKFALSGAQPVEVFQDMIKKAAEEKSLS